MIRRIRSSLGLQIATIATLTIIGLTSVAVVAAFIQQNHSGSELALEKTASIATVAAVSTAPVVDFAQAGFSLNDASFDDALKGVLKLQDFAFVVVNGKAGDTLYTHNYQQAPAALLKNTTAPQRFIHNDIAIAFVPIASAEDGKKIGTVALGLHLHQMHASVSSSIQTFTIVGIIGAVVSAFVMFFWVQRLTRPVVRLRDAAQKVSTGNLEQKIHTRAINELGELSAAFNTMVDNIRKGIADLADEKISVERKVEQAVRDSEMRKKYLSFSVDIILNEMRKFAEGNLAVDLAVAIENDEIGELYDGFNHAVANVREMMTQIARSLAETSHTSSEITRITKQLAHGATEQSTQALQIASAVEELAQTVSENSVNAHSSLATAQNNGSIAASGGVIVQETIAKMEEIANIVNNSTATIEQLGSSSAEIGAIVSVINEIADQTNLLALNAAIEAARAGDQGRGFAVVADEVRKLAERTSEATKQIATMVRKIQQETQTAVKVMNEGNKEVFAGKELAAKAGEALQHIVTSSTEVARIVQTIAEASQQQSSAAQQLAHNIATMTSVIRQSEQGAREIASSTGNLNSSMIDVQRLMSRFTTADRAIALKEMEELQEPQKLRAVSAVKELSM